MKREKTYNTFQRRTSAQQRDTTQQAVRVGRRRPMFGGIAHNRVPKKGRNNRKLMMMVVEKRRQLHTENLVELKVLLFCWIRVSYKNFFLSLLFFPPFCFALNGVSCSSTVVASQLPIVEAR